MKSWFSVVGVVGALVTIASCEIDDPCDPGQNFENAACVVPPDPESTPMDGQGGGDMMDTGDTTADAGVGDLNLDGGLTTLSVEPLDTDFGTACADPVASSDCGGTAPICLPPMGGGVCSQILCLAGEANEGVCPANLICLAADPTQPSVCLDPAVLGG